MYPLKITQTDHKQQALVLFPRINCILRSGMEAILNDKRLPSELRDDALQLKRHLEDPESQDKPVRFTKSHGSLMNCPECLGTRNEKQKTEDHNLDMEFIPCSFCKGEGQLYYEVIRKYYVPTEYHRKKLAK